MDFYHSALLTNLPLMTMSIGGLVVAVVLIQLLRGSLVYIPNTSYGILERKWRGSPLGKAERRFGLISLDNAPGFVPEVLRGGWHVLTPFQYRVHKKPLIRIDTIGYIVARVGQTLSEGQVLGAWPLVNGTPIDVEDARGFLTNGGQAGFQRHFLRSKTYAINTALFCIITEGEILNIEAGSSKDDEELQALLGKRNAFEPIVIADDTIGILTVQDGPSLAHGEIIAPTVGANVDDPSTFHNSFQDIPKFLIAGGRRGRQEQVLVEGTYYINRMFATIEIKPKTKVGIGTVGVVNSYVGRDTTDALTADGGRGRTVEKGKRGIWENPLEPGMYAINPYGAEVTHVPTTNFQLRWMDGVRSVLNDARAVSNRVSFDDDLREVPVLTADGFEILLPIAVVAHIKPANAPYVIQRFSQVSRFVNQTLDPLVSSYFRDAAQAKTLLEFIKEREQIASQALQMMKTRLAEHRIDIEEVLLGTPREVEGKDNVDRLFDQLRQRQTAQQQKDTFDAQGVAAAAKKDLNEKLAIAEQQSALTASRIAIEVSRNEGQASAVRAEQEAAGTRVRADAEAYTITERGKAMASASKATSDAVGGPDNLMRQYLAQQLAEAITKSPHKLVPDTVLNGSGGNLLDALMAMSASTGAS